MEDDPTIEMHDEMQHKTNVVNELNNHDDSDSDEHQTDNQQTSNKCINCMFNRRYKHCGLWWIITFILLAVLSMLIIRFSLENLMAMIIMIILLIVPCFVLCGIKCKLQKLISIKTHFIIYTVSILIGAFLGGIWRASVMCYFVEPTFDVWSNWNAKQHYGTVNALINAAILASNPHNSQAYKFKINNINDNRKQLDIFVDFERNIKYIDSLYREMHIGIGCIIENAMLSAAFNQFVSNISYYPNIDDKSHIARIDLYSDESNAITMDTMDLSLYNNIPHRHTDRYAYDRNKAIDATQINEMDKLNEFTDTIKVYWFITETEKEAFGDLHIEGVEAVTSGDERLSKGSYEWVRHTCNEYKSTLSGIWLDASGLSESVEFMGKVFPPISREEEDSYWLAAEKEKKGACSVYGIIAAKNHSNNLERVYLGRYWQKLHLYATANGISMQPLNQMIEARDIEVYDNCVGNECVFVNKLIQLMDLMNTSNINQPLFGFRAGYGTTDNIFKSSRRPPNDVTM
eukprot:295760_1